MSCFEDEFAEFAAGFARGEYLMWLGSGISRGVVPGVPKLLEQMLEFLRTNIDDADPACRCRRAMNEILDLVSLPASSRTAIDFSLPVSAWPHLEDLIGRLNDKYADVLNVSVDGEPEDYLVWTALDVPHVYGSTSLEPDVEHLCVAILMLEGLVRSAPTTNWDGLVEAAIALLTAGHEDILNVIVTAADCNQPDARSELIKFHGCAVRAAADEESFRARLVARRSQISGWTAKAENRMLRQRLELLFASRPAFVVGLSLQDANIHTVLHQANNSLVRDWPTSPPAIVLAEQDLHAHHKLVLQVTYGDTHAANVEAIRQSALLGAYAKPALVGLVLYTLADKLSALPDFRRS